MGCMWLWLLGEGEMRIRSGICKTDKNINDINFCQCLFLCIMIILSPFHDIRATDGLRRLLLPQAASRTHCLSDVTLGPAETCFWLFIIYWILSWTMFTQHQSSQKLKIPRSFAPQTQLSNRTGSPWYGIPKTMVMLYVLAGFTQLANSLIPGPRKWQSQSLWDVG